jgi:hypothetical protein
MVAATSRVCESARVATSMTHDNIINTFVFGVQPDSEHGGGQPDSSVPAAATAEEVAAEDLQFQVTLVQVRPPPLPTRSCVADVTFLGVVFWYCVLHCCILGFGCGFLDRLPAILLETCTRSSSSLQQRLRSSCRSYWMQ